MTHGPELQWLQLDDAALAALSELHLAGSLILGFFVGLGRARQRETLDAGAKQRRKQRRKALEAARADKDLAAVEHVLYDALAERFGAELRGLTSDELGRRLEDRLAPDTKKALIAWLEAAHAARYAPRGGADKKGLFDDATGLLSSLEEAS